LIVVTTLIMMIALIMFIFIRKILSTLGKARKLFAGNFGFF
jgi:hypothetical protein